MCSGQWPLAKEHMATDGGSYNLLSKLGQFCKWTREVWIIRRGDPAPRGMVPGKPVCVMALRKNSPHRWTASFCQESRTFLAAPIISATTWWPGPPDSLSITAALVSHGASPSSPSPYRYLVGMGTLGTECPRAWKRGGGGGGGEILALAARHAHKMYVWYPELGLSPCFFMVERY